MGPRIIRAELTEYNALSDGPCGVVLMWDDESREVASVVCAEAFDLEAVAQIPGDDRAFPVAAVAEALAASQVQDRP